MKITTSTGFTIDMNPKKVTDWRFIKLLAKAEAIEKSDDGTGFINAFADAVSMLLGEKGGEKLEKHCTDKDGICSAPDIVREFREILSLCGKEVKK